MQTNEATWKISFVKEVEQRDIKKTIQSLKVEDPEFIITKRLENVTTFGLKGKLNEVKGKSLENRVFKLVKVELKKTIQDKIIVFIMFCFNSSHIQNRFIFEHKQTEEITDLFRSFTKFDSCAKFEERLVKLAQL